MGPTNLICLVPVFNDWESLSVLIKDINDLANKTNDLEITVVVINDGSTEKNNLTFVSSDLIIDFVDLALNVGHQRAIAIGVQYILNEIVKKYPANQSQENGYLAILDGDGEDKPSDILPMLEKAKDKVVFARRVKRSEGVRFKLGYFFYKKLFALLTGKKINYGNFSVVPFSILEDVSILPNIWNHYAGSVAESKIHIDTHPTERGIRYAGKSKMNPSSLIIHGFSSIAIYFDILCFRILKFTFIAFIVCTIFIGHVLFQKLFTNNAIPGWASSLILIVLSIIIQLFSVTFIILLLQLRSRKEVSPPDLQLYKKFIKPTL